MGETLSRHASDLKLPQHNSSHMDLLPYSDLMAWMKRVDRSNYQKLAKVKMSKHLWGGGLFERKFDVLLFAQPNISTLRKSPCLLSSLL